MGEDGSKGQGGELRLTERDRKREGGKREEIARGEQGFIPADRGRDMTPVGKETDNKGRD